MIMNLGPNTVHALLVVIVMIGGGALGGVASYLSTKISKEESRPLLKRIVLGIIAAFVVPLFLNMISSAIILDTAGWTDYLVFMGFCVVAGFSSKSFLSSISKRILDKVQIIEEKHDELAEEVDPLLARVTEPEAATELIMSEFQLDDSDQKVLRALNNPKYIRRSVSGIEKATGFSDVEVVDHLSNLKKEGLVNQRSGQKGDLFWLTSLGRQLIQSM